MRRSLLATMTVLGALICLVGSTGLYAALTETATTGTNTATSDDLPTSIDLKLARGQLAERSVECGTPVDDLVSPLITETDMQPGAFGSAMFCLRNDGAQTAAHVSVRTIELTGGDTRCTGDEVDSGDTSCGTDASDGELADFMSVAFSVVACATGVETYSSGEIGLVDSTTTDLSLAAVPAGTTSCVRVTVAYLPGDPIAVQLAQSDSVSWRYRFTAGL